MDLFGFSITKKDKKKNRSNSAERTNAIVAPSFAEADEESYEVSGNLTQSFIANFLDDYSAKSETDLISVYREMALHPDISIAIDEIVNDAIVYDDFKSPVNLTFINTKENNLSKTIQTKIAEEFNYVLRMLKFTEHGDRLFRRWFIDGKIYLLIVVDKSDSNKKPSTITDIRIIDPRYIKKVRKIIKNKASFNKASVVEEVQEYFLYKDPNDKSLKDNEGIQLTPDSVIFVTSGLEDTDGKIVSYLYPAIKAYNQLVSMEDSLVVYRVARAPERRVFYVDVGNLPKTRAEQYLKSIIAKHNNKIVYDSRTGSIKNNKHVLSMMEDIWLPRREGSRGTEVDTLPGAQSLGEMDDILWFHKKLYKALHIPTSRLDSDTAFNLGRASEISRDEVRFAKFISKLQKRFAHVFRQALRVQLILKNIIDPEEWDEINQQINFVFNVDSHFEELKESEILRNRLEVLDSIDQYIDKYFSLEYVQKHVLRMTDSEIEEIAKQREQEAKQNPQDSDNTDTVDGF